MSEGNTKYRLRLATAQDSPAIGRVLEDGSFPGSIAVRFTRRPDPYQSYRNDGDDLVMAVAEDRRTGEIAAVGGCVLRQAYINGEAAPTGYLTGMKIQQGHRGGAVPIRQAYQFIRRETENRCSTYLTTILSGNTGAIRLLEKPRKNMPFYRFQGEYTVFCLGSGGKPKLSHGLRLVEGGEGVAEFYRQHLPTCQFAPTDHRLHGLEDSGFYTLRTPSGEILAACALWDQQRYKQYRIAGYSPLLRLLQKLPTHLLGYPSLPRENTFAQYASLALPLIRPDAVDFAAAFLRGVAAQAEEYDFLMLGLMEDHPLCPPVRKLRHIRYTSRVYTVEFPGAPPLELDGRPFQLEVGLL